MERQNDPIRRRTAAEAGRGRIRWAPAADGGGFARRRNSGLRLMIVEDEVFVAFNMQQILESAGHKVVGDALTAEAAIEKAGRLLPDLILMDIRLLSRRDGVDAALEIRARYGIRSVFASACTDDETSLRARMAEPLGFVSKPFTRASLITAIEKYARLL
jgi:DNA-binding NarL/FixJ family response regulator